MYLEAFQAGSVGPSEKSLAPLAGLVPASVTFQPRGIQCPPVTWDTKSDSPPAAGTAALVLMLR